MCDKAGMAISGSFAHWNRLLNKPVYSLDGNKLGFLRDITGDYMIVKKGFVSLTKYFIPISLAESEKNKGITIKISALEAMLKYSSDNIARFDKKFDTLNNGDTRHRVLIDRLQTIRFSTTRNRLAAGLAFVAGILFLVSGYKANLDFYGLVEEQIRLHTANNLWTYALLPVGMLAILSQLGGLALLIGAGLFAANRVNLGKFLVMVGTGQGLLTILLYIVSELFSSNGWSSLLDNYVTWLLSSITGLGVIFAILSQSVSKGKDESINSRLLRFMLRRPRKD
jgi:hypothetical protein